MKAGIRDGHEEAREPEAIIKIICNIVEPLQLTKTTSKIINESVDWIRERKILFKHQ